MVADAVDAVAVGEHAVRYGSDTVNEEMVDRTVALGLGKIGECIGLGRTEQSPRRLHPQPGGLDAAQPGIPVAAGDVAPGQLAVDLPDRTLHNLPLPSGVDIDDTDT